MNPSSLIATLTSSTSSATTLGSSESILLRSIDLSVANPSVCLVIGGGTQAGTVGLPAALGEGGSKRGLDGMLRMWMLWE